MWAFGWKVTDPSSPRKKQYTMVAMGDRVIVNYGASNSPGATKEKLNVNLSAANGEEEVISLVNKLATTVYSEFQDRHQKGTDYTQADIYPAAVLIRGDNNTDAAEVVKNFVEKAQGLTGLGLATMLREMNKYKQKARAEVLGGDPSAAPSASPVAPATKPADKLVVDNTTAFKRPNGEIYHSRSVMGHQDVALIRKMRDAGIPIRLYGPPGAGKTALVEAALGELITVNGHGDMTVSHFAGTLLPTPEGGWQWVHGPLAQAMEKGLPFFVDEILRIPTEVLAVLYSVMDGRGELRLDDRPDLEPIKAKEGFYVIAGYNPDLLGGRGLDEALTSRFRLGIEVTTDYDTAAALGVPEKAVRLARNLQTRNEQDKADGGLGVWVPQMRELLTFRDLVNAGLEEEFALSALVSACPREEDVEALATVAQRVFGVTDLTGLSLGRRF